MIVDLPSTTTADIAKRLVRLRSDIGAMALTRVLTLIVVVAEDQAEDAIRTANEASRQHPCRILVVVTANARGQARLDGQIRVGGDAGASEVVVLRLYGALTKHGASVVTPLLLPDSPIVAWWPTTSPKDVSTSPIGKLAARRITDAARCCGQRPRTTLTRLAETYQQGDTDLAWSRITRWRSLLAATLDQPPYERVSAATVVGSASSPSVDLLAAWLTRRLRCPVTIERTSKDVGIVEASLTRESGTIRIFRPAPGDVGTLEMPGQPERTIALRHRTDAECLADELHRLDADEIFADTLIEGVPMLSGPVAKDARAKPGRRAMAAKSGQGGKASR